MIRRFALFGLLLGLLFIGGLVAAPTIVHAQEAGGVCADQSSGFLDFPTWYKYLSFDPGNDCELTVTIPEDLGKILLAVFEIILRVGGLAAVGFVIYGGIQYILSQGEPDRTKAAKNTILNAIIGVMIAIFSAAIVNLIGNGLT